LSGSPLKIGGPTVGAIEAHVLTSYILSEGGEKGVATRGTILVSILKVGRGIRLLFMLGSKFI